MYQFGIIAEFGASTLEGVAAAEAGDLLQASLDIPWLMLYPKKEEEEEG